MPDLTQLYPYGIGLVLGLSPVVAFSLLFITAPYGRHQREGWGPSISPRLAWVFMESPSLFLFLGLVATGPYVNLPALALTWLWLVHYGQRTLIYPTMLPKSASPMPVGVAAMGFGFNVVNGGLNALALTHLEPYPPSWLTDPRLWIGGALFLAGWGINLHSDHVLRTLREPGETGYKIPNRGLHRWVASPNYLGELIEWAGFAIAAWNGAALAFAIFTAANLAPRAWTHLKWYRERFEDYPAHRKALIPGIF